MLNSNEIVRRIKVNVDFEPEDKNPVLEIIIYADGSREFLVLQGATDAVTS